jgi:hypothetical protein
MRFNVSYPNAIWTNNFKVTSVSDSISKIAVSTVNIFNIKLDSFAS